MNNTSFLPIFLALAILFLAACGSDDGNNATPSNGLLPKHLYLDVSLQRPLGAPPIKYEGDGVINIRIGVCEIEATLPAGTIKNGQIIWDLPEINGEYLKPFPAFCGEPSEVAVSYPKNLKMTTAHIGAVITGYGSVCLKLMDSENRMNNSPDRNINYYSEGGEIKGSVVWEGNDVVFYDLKISKGWNIINVIDNGLVNSTYSSLETTNPPPLVGELVLWENCSWK